METILLFSAFAAPAPADFAAFNPPAALVVAVAKPAPAWGLTGYRQPQGHTHTDARGHTWDHTANPTHTCTVPGCGLSQNFVDTVPRMVPVYGWIEPKLVPEVIAPPGMMAETPPPRNPVPFAELGCVGGNCGNAVEGRRGLFGWRR